MFLEIEIYLPAHKLHENNLIIESTRQIQLIKREENPKINKILHAQNLNAHTIFSLRDKT